MIYPYFNILLIAKYWMLLTISDLQNVNVIPNAMPHLTIYKISCKLRCKISSLRGLKRNKSYVLIETTPVSQQLLFPETAVRNKLC